MRKRYFLLLYIICSIFPLFPLEEVGKVLALTGEVEYDILGKANFTRLAVGDALYDKSVIRTGKDGLATINVYNQEIKIPPASLISLADLTKSGLTAHNIDTEIYKQLIQALQGLFKNNYEQIEQKNKGMIETKATSADSLSNFFIEQKMNGEFYKKARQAIYNQDYDHALLSLKAIEDARTLKSYVSEYYALCALCYFFLNQYRQADELFLKASQQTREQAENRQADALAAREGLRELEKKFYETDELFTMSAGITNCLLDKYQDAISYFKEILSEKKTTVLIPYAYYFLSYTLQQAGMKEEARACLKAATQFYPAQPWSQAWSGLLQRL